MRMARARGAMLGLALGDAFGRPLEFLDAEAARTAPVDVDRLRWTDDTHMALYLARAVLDVPPGPLDDDAFGHAVGRRFAEWLDDPLTPRTAPGRTCMAGARAYRRTGSWLESGVRESDGCGAVMRLPPVALAWSGEDLARAARIQAMVTHAHPNALESAVAGALLLRALLDGAPLEAGLVREVAQEVRRRHAEGGIAAEALEAAVETAARLGRTGGTALPEEDIPPGDGGWRSPSALGLAACAALAWGTDFAPAVERACRIGGDSDSVGAVAGALVGAALGVEALPVRWLAGLRDRDEIDDAARAVLDRGAGPSAAPTRPVRLPVPGDGALVLLPLPREAAPLAQTGALLVVLAGTDAEALDDLARECAELGLAALPLSAPDGRPHPAALEVAAGAVAAAVEAGRPVALAGDPLAAAGRVAIAALVRRGMPRAAAADRVRRLLGPAAPEPDALADEAG